MTTRLLQTTLAALLCMAAAAPALAQSADLGTWTAAGDVLRTGPGSATLTTAFGSGGDDNEGPVSGSSALVFTELEPALLLDAGSLPADTVEGSGLQHSFVAAAGSTIRFAWQLTTVDFNADFADRAFVLVDGATLIELGTVSSGAVSGQFSHSVASAGSHALAILVMDVNDATGVSTLTMSDLTVSAVPEPGPWALLLAGLAGLGLAARRRAAQPTV